MLIKHRLQLFDADGKLFTEKLMALMLAIQKDSFLFADKFSSPKLWNAESPNLYKAVFTIYKNGKVSSYSYTRNLVSEQSK